MSEKINRCKNCIHWHNKQRLLNYMDSVGICLNDAFRFNTNNGRLIGVIDTDNERDRQKVSGNCAHDIETHQYTMGPVHTSRYLLQTSEDFGCIFHEKK